MTTNTDMFLMENAVGYSGPFISEIFIAPRKGKLHIQNLTSSAPENRSYASIMIMQGEGSSADSRVLPLGKSEFDVPHGAAILASADTDSVSILICWE